MRLYQPVMLRVGVVISLLMLASLACNFPTRGNATEAAPLTPAPNEAMYTEPAPLFPTPTLAAEQLVPTSTQAPPQGASEVEYNGVRFQNVAPVFSDVRATVASMQQGEAGMTGWLGSAPEHYRFELVGYPLSDPWIQPQILIYPIQRYAEVNTSAGEIAADLDAELRTVEVKPESRPFLPMWNAGQVFNARVEILPFQNGRGLRYLTCYAQSLVRIDNRCLFYTYQGLSADGKYYVSAILPVDLPSLYAAEAAAKWEKVTGSDDPNVYLQYLADMRQVLAAARPEEFSPNLNDLDLLIKSLAVNPTVQLNAPPLAAFSCSGALATRLTPAMRARVTFTDGTPLRVRDAPGKSAKILITIPEGTEMFILEGPKCADKGVWWRMQNNNGSLTGWVMEGEGGVYFIEPWQ